MRAEECNREMLLQILNVLGLDYLSICVIDIEKQTITLLKKTDKGAESLSENRVEYPYNWLCRKILERFAPADQQEALMNAVSLPTLQISLAQKESRSFLCHTSSGEVVQAKYSPLDADMKHILMTLRYVDPQVSVEQEKTQKAEQKVEHLEKEKQEAIRSNEMKNRFLSSLSHDLRTPINGLQGMLRIADAYPKDLKKQSECREKMWIAADYLGILVNNVLDMKRLENPAAELSTAPFNLIDLLMDITAITDIQLEEQGLRSVVDWKPGYINHRFLIGSAEGLNRILTNLNSNAIKYNKKGGTVYCRCKEIRCEGDTVWVEIVTADTGIGMDEDFLQRAFDPYARRNDTTLNTIHGVGLGLAIVQQTVELMHGTIKVESKLGEGTRYTIVLPFKIDPNPNLAPPKVDQISLKGVRALLVEDNNLNMEIAKFCLEQEDVEVHVALNGQEAVDKFHDSDVGFYDIILMDIMMPIMDGLDATRRIRAMNRTDSLTVPIIAMSANVFEQDIEKSLAAGMNAYLTKPIKPEQLTSTMKKYLANKVAR